MNKNPNETPAGANSNPSRKLTKQELAVHLGVSTRHIDRLINRNAIPFLRIGRRCLRFDAAKVEAALSAYEVQAA